MKRLMPNQNVFTYKAMNNHSAASMIIKAFTLSLLFILSQPGYAHYPHAAEAGYQKHRKGYFPKLPPRSLKGKNIVLQIEQSHTDEFSAQPNQGVIIKSYINGHSYDSTGLGGEGHTDTSGYYRFKPIAHNKAIEYSYDSNTGIRTKIRYQFTSAHAGQWQQHNTDGTEIMSGSFFLNESNIAPNDFIAPENHNGLTVALNIIETESQIPPQFYPSRAVVLQSYKEDGTYSAIGFGPGAIPHSGTYTYERVAKNIVVEQTVQNNGDQVFPYTLIYHYDTPISGTWYQNFGNGLILFSGTFSTFLSE